MKTPILEELKEYFKDAEILRERGFTGVSFKINWEEVNKSDFGNWCQGDSNYLLWSPNIGYAKIISYKEVEKPIFQYLSVDTWVDFCEQKQIRIKPKPNYDKEIEALQNKAKENGMKVIINFEKL